MRRLHSGYEQIESVCTNCKNLAENVRYNGLTPQERREYGRRVNFRTRVRQQLALRQVSGLAHELERAERKIAKQEEKLEAVRNRYRRPRGVEDGNAGIAVDIIPFRMWLLREHRMRGYETKKLAEDIGQDARKVSDWLQGFVWNGEGREPRPIRAINVTTIDNIAIALEDPGLLYRLYPLEEVIE